jgi:hypothetical protein
MGGSKTSVNAARGLDAMPSQATGYLSRQTTPVASPPPVHPVRRGRHMWSRPLTPLDSILDSNSATFRFAELPSAAEPFREHRP